MIEGEFSLADWQGAGLNVASVVKRGLYTIHESLVIKMVGRLGTDDTRRIDAALRQWLGLWRAWHKASARFQPRAEELLSDDTEIS
jgi:hypothetical protein